MLDSNAAYFDYDLLFFLEVHSSDPNLRKLGIQDGQLILCKHMNELKERKRFHEPIKIWTSLNSKCINISPTTPTLSPASLVYAGVVDGDGFIDNRSIMAAKKFLGGKWLSNENLKKLLNI